MPKKDVLAIIPARGGSKGIPGKNIRGFAGRPLIVHSIETALSCQQVSRTVVSTDDDRIAEISVAHGAEVIRRPSELATDSSLVVDTIRHAIRMVEQEGGVVDIAILLEPTSPMRRMVDLEKCIQVLQEEEADSAATFTGSHISPNRLWRVEKDIVEPFIDGAVPWLPRQQQPKAYELTGQVYAVTKKALLDNENSVSQLVGKIFPILTPSETALDIDTELDFIMAEKIFEHFKHRDDEQ